MMDHTDIAKLYDTGATETEHGFNTGSKAYPVSPNDDYPRSGHEKGNARVQASGDEVLRGIITQSDCPPTR